MNALLKHMYPLEIIKGYNQKRLTGQNLVYFKLSSTLNGGTTSLHVVGSQKDLNAIDTIAYVQLYEKLKVHYYIKTLTHKGWTNYKTTLMIKDGVNYGNEIKRS